jgi:hypothetical protein
MSEGDYSSAGFNDFLVRSIDSAPSANLSQLPPNPNRELNYDSQAVRGSLGDTLQVGLVDIKGRDGVIEVKDSSGDMAIRIGNPEDPGQLLVPKGAAYIYDRDGIPTIVNGRIVGNKILGKIKLETTVYVPNNCTAGNVSMAKLANTDIYCTIPDGVTVLKMSTTIGAFMYATEISSNQVPIAQQLTNPDRLAGYSSTFIFIDVIPNSSMHFFIAADNGDSGSQSAVGGFTKQSPGLFMIEIG